MSTLKMTRLVVYTMQNASPVLSHTRIHVAITHIAITHITHASCAPRPTASIEKSGSRIQPVVRKYVQERKVYQPSINPKTVHQANRLGRRRRRSRKSRDDFRKRLDFVVCVPHAVVVVLRGSIVLGDYNRDNVGLWRLNGM